MSTINDLSDAILCEILAYIGLVERQRLEIVCKRWRQVIRILWSKISKLTIDIIYDHDSFGFEVRKNVSNVLEIVATKPSEIGAILKICQNNLTELIIVDEGPYGDATDLYEPLRDCWNLKSFFIDTYDNTLIRDFLKCLPTQSLEKLQVYNIEYEFTEEIDDIIAEILVKTELLTSLGLGGVSLEVLDIIKGKSALKWLRIGNLNESIDTVDLSLHVTNLINLEELIIEEERMVDDELLIQIAENCKKLRRVKLWTENSIHNGLKALKTLPSLRSVNLLVPKEMGVLDYFSNLEEFYCSHS